MEILVGLIAIVFIGICVYFLMSFIWSSTRGNTSPRITFNAFKELYAISPSKWSLGFDDVSYYGDDGWIFIEFKHYIDVLRYGFFKDKIESEKEYLLLIQNEKEFIESLQKDIESYREENLREMKRILQK